MSRTCIDLFFQDDLARQLEQRQRAPIPRQKPHFFAPLTRTVPSSGSPPRMMSLSMSQHFLLKKHYLAGKVGEVR